MFCGKCGNEVADGERFCGVCGTEMTTFEVVTVGQALPAKREFYLLDKCFEVAPEVDAFNSYRNDFKKLATNMAAKFRDSYNSYIFDFNTYINQFPQMYHFYLDEIIKQAINILVSEGVWTVTAESFKEEHLADFHLAIDTYDIMIKNFNGLLENKRVSNANKMSYVPGFAGFGLSGILTATALNIAATEIGNSIVNNTNVTPVERQRLYDSLDKEMLFDKVFHDYWRVFLTMTYLLKQNGKRMWYPDGNQINQASNLFANISNPNFPEAQIPDAIDFMLKADPYDDRYYDFFVSKFGERDDITNLRNYFGVE